MNNVEIESVAEKIRSGRIGILPTDTIYGVVASARDKDAVDKVYVAKNRDRYKKLILLTGSFDQLDDIGVKVNQAQRQTLETVWPGPVSAELKCESDEYEYLHNGTGCLAVRLPEPGWLRTLLEKTGPIVATSANPAGMPTPRTIEAVREIMPGLDFYYQGVVSDKPSSIVRVHADGRLEWLQRT